MDVDKMLAELRLERQQIEEAILTLERLARGRGRRRGRPPAWLRESQPPDASEEQTPDTADREVSFSPEPRRRGRPPGSSNKVKRMMPHALEG